MNINFRDASELDRTQIAEWIAADSCEAHHAVGPDFWLPSEEEPGKCYAVCEDGEVLFYLKLENVVRCYVQFPPDGKRDKLATAIGLKKTFLTIAAGGKSNGYKEVIFSTKSEGLKNLFAGPKSRFGFVPATDDLKVRI